VEKLQRKYMLSRETPKMGLAEKTKILSSFPMFEETSTAELKEVATKTQPEAILPMEVFVEEDRDEHQAYFLYQGAVSVFRTTSEGEIINLDLLGAPNLVGEVGLIEDKSSPASIIAIEETRALVLSQKDFQALVNKNPKLALNLLKVFADKMRDFDLFIEELLSKNLYERTWNMLQFVSQYFPKREITLSQEQLTDLLWGTRSRVTEVLNKLETEGKIKIGHRKVKVL